MFGGATILMRYHSQTLFLMLHSQIALSSEVASSACLVVWSEVPHMCRGMMPRTLICRGFTTLVPILLLLALLGWLFVESYRRLACFQALSLFLSFSHLYMHTRERACEQSYGWLLSFTTATTTTYADQYQNKTQILKWFTVRNLVNTGIAWPKAATYTGWNISWEGRALTLWSVLKGYIYFCSDSWPVLALLCVFVCYWPRYTTTRKCLLTVLAGA